jgi:hypothetical protein
MPRQGAKRPSHPFTNTAGGVTTAYNVFGIAWVPGQATPATPLPSTATLALGLCAAAIYLLRKRTAGLETKAWRFAVRESGRSVLTDQSVCPTLLQFAVEGFARK